MPLKDYSTTAGSNSAISGTNVAEGCLPSGINDAIRQMMADLATDALIRNIPTTTGSGGTYAVTLVPAAISWTNLLFFCIANADAVGADTINPNALGAKALYKHTSSGPAAVAAGDFKTGDLMLIGYDGTHAQILSALPSAASGTAASANTGTSGHTLPYLDGTNTWSGVQTFNSGDLSATSPTFVTPTLGAATGTSLTFSPTTGGIVGTTTNDNTGAGKVGQLIESSIASASAVSLSSGAPADITSISLTAGDWDVWGNVVSKPASGTTTGAMQVWISSTSASVPTLPNGGAYYRNDFLGAQADFVFAQPTGMMRLSLSGTTTVYLSTTINFGVSTMGAYGYIGARRRR